MSLASFLRQLTERACLEVEPPAAAGSPSDETAEVEAALRDMADQLRLELAFEPPTLSLPSAVWATGLIHRACQFLVFREIGPEQVARAMAQPCPERPSPVACFSADLTLRFLPDLVRIARGVSPDDPLVTGLLTLSKAWPLSSVGVRKLGPLNTSAFWGHPSLRQLYVDRILASGDADRLDDPAVRQAVRAAVGMHGELAGALKEHVTENEAA